MLVEEKIGAAARLAWSHGLTARGPGRTISNFAQARSEFTQQGGQVK
jgi:hypothetical protein